MKIVIPVDTDKKTVVTKTGQCAYFAVYEDEKVFDYIENTHAHPHDHKGEKHHHEGGDDHSHKKDVGKLSGCDLILVRAVGENMKEALDSIGLEIRKIRKKDGENADEVIKNFLAGNL